MDQPILTQRLLLVPLSLNQLELILQNPVLLERSLDTVVMQDSITERVGRAIRKKIDRMRKA